MEGAIRRFPFLANAEIVKLVCHPDALTPDANPLMGPMPGVPAFGLRRAFAQRLWRWRRHRQGDGRMDGRRRAFAGRVRLRAWRFGRIYQDPCYAAEAARESYKYYYRLRYPFDQDEWGRPRRVSALYSRLQDLGAVFGKRTVGNAPILSAGPAVAPRGRRSARMGLGQGRRILTGWARNIKPSVSAWA